jgi:hypothetical protein
MGKCATFSSGVAAPTRHSFVLPVAASIGSFGSPSRSGAVKRVVRAAILLLGYSFQLPFYSVEPSAGQAT